MLNKWSFHGAEQIGSTSWIFHLLDFWSKQVHYHRKRESRFLTFQIYFFYLLIWERLKVIVNSFSFFLKALFVLKIFICVDFLAFLKNGLVRKIGLILKFMTFIIFDFLEKSLEIVSPPHFVYVFLLRLYLCTLLTDQILFPDCLYFLRYWLIYVLQLFVNQVVMSKILKLILSFWSSCFLISWKIQDTNLEREEVLSWNKRHFSSFLNGFHLSEIVSDLRVHL